jgi:hypothetical protein
MKYLEEAPYLHILKRMAYEETDKLKVYFTKKEIEKLNEEEFHPDYIDTCIYGLMTGDCRSERAVEFIDKNIDTVIGSEYSSNRSLAPYRYLTPLEKYIQQGNAGVEVLNYIKA